MAVHAFTLQAADFQALQDADVQALGTTVQKAAGCMCKFEKPKRLVKHAVPIECPRHAIWAAESDLPLSAAYTGCRNLFELPGLVPMLSDKLLCNGNAAGCGSRGVGRLRYTQTLTRQDLLTHRVTRPACSRSFRLCPLHPAAAVCFCCCTYSSACMPHQVVGWAQPLLQTAGMPAGPDQEA